MAAVPQPPPKRPQQCPLCRKAPATESYRPFCSRRCADLDLQRWFSGGYAVPTDETPDGDEYA